jgi:hypothetical protein
MRGFTCQSARPSDNVAMREAASTPLGPMPLAVLAHARPFDLTEEAEGFSPVH